MGQSWTAKKLGGFAAIRIYSSLCRGNFLAARRMLHSLPSVILSFSSSLYRNQMSTHQSQISGYLVSLSETRYDLNLDFVYEMNRCS